jgi:hypothetical protein
MVCMSGLETRQRYLVRITVMSGRGFLSVSIRIAKKDIWNVDAEEQLENAPPLR